MMNARIATLEIASTTADALALVRRAAAAVK